MVRSALLVAVCSLVAASAAHASLAEALPLEALVRDATHVVHARTERTSSRYEGHAIVTTVSLAVIEPAKGRARVGEVLEVVHLGGVVGDVAMRVEGAPAFTVGTESVVFAGEVNGRLTPVGMSQGVLPVRVERGVRRVAPGGAGLALVVRRNGRLLPAPAATADRPLRELLDDVRSLAETP